MDLGIAGRKAIVCASSKGLGRGCAEALAEAGCELVLNGRDKTVLEATAGIIRQASGSLASESVRNVRIQSIEADRAVERVIDRFRLRRHLGPDGQLPGSPAT